MISFSRWPKVYILVSLLLWPVAASSQDVEMQQPTDLLEALIRLRTPAIEFLASRPTIVKAVVEQNQRNVSLDEIKKIDKEWRAQQGLTAFKQEFHTNEAGRLLKSMVDRTTQIYAEAMLTDNQGALVAGYPAPSDYWQGDEEKWKMAWKSGQLEIGLIGFDRSTHAYICDVSVPIFDDSGLRAGVLIMGVRITKGPQDGNRIDD